MQKTKTKNIVFTIDNNNTKKDQILEDVEPPQSQQLKSQSPTKNEIK